MKKYVVLMVFLFVSVSSQALLAGQNEKEEIDCNFQYDYSQLEAGPERGGTLLTKFEYDLKTAENYITAKRGKSCIKPYNTAKKINSAVFVDLRSEEDYLNYHIPASINVKEYELTSKAFLKNRPVVLVDYPYSYTERVKTCDDMNEQGFSAVYLLEDGIAGYGKTQLASRPEAEQKAMAKNTFISPREFDSLSRKDRWIIIYLSQNNENQKSIRSDNVYVVNELSQDKLRKAAAMFAAKNGYIPNMLVVTDKGEKHLFDSKKIPSSFIFNIFYLETGIEGYNKFLSDSQITLSTNRLRKAAEKIGCGKR